MSLPLPLRLSFIAAMAVTCGWAQLGTSTTGSQPNGGTATSGSNGTVTGTNDPVQTPPPTTGSGAPGPRPIFISGTVMMDDGSSLPEGVNIQSVCGPLRRTMGHTGANGGFEFKWSTTATAFGDASQTVRGSGAGGAGSLTGSRNGSRGLDPVANCDLVAESAGYSSSRVSLYDRAGQDSYDVGPIVLHRIAAGEGRTVSVLALKAPRDAKKSFDKGVSLAAAHKLPAAVASFESAVASYPEYADAWLGMGKVQWEMGGKEAARGSFAKALDLDSKLVGPWQELGFLACDDSKWEDAIRYLDQAVRLDPMDSPGAWYYDALANYNLGRFAQAERSVRAEMKLDRGANPREVLLLGLVLIGRRDLEGGAEALRNYIATAPESEDVTLARKQLSSLESRIRP